MSRLTARETAQNALPSPDERRRLRELWDLTPHQVAVAFGVRTATVRSWESGRSEPKGQRRAAYRRFLQGLAQRADLRPRAAAAPPSAPPSAVPPFAVPPLAALPGSRSPEPAVRDRPAAPAAVVPQRVPAAAAADWALPVGAGAPASGWLPRVGAVATTLAAWVLVLVLLDAYLPGAAG